jgi:hypothetical protein
MGCECSNP